MVKLTEEQRKELEALANMPDEEIDLSDIPERPIDWSKAKIAPFYRPIWKDFSLRVDEGALNCLDRGLTDGQTLDDAVNKALRAQMFRIRFPVRVQKAEKAILRVQESLREIAGLTESQIQEIEILYAMPVEKVASFRVVTMRGKIEEQHRAVKKDVCLKLDENIVDWFEYGLEDGQSLDEAISKALMDHIMWIRSPREMQKEEEPAGKPTDSA